MQRTRPFRIDSVFVAASVLAVTLALSCSSPGKSAKLTDVGDSAFPSNVQSGVVIAEAYFYSNHEAVLGEDLIDSDDVIPIGLRVGVKGKGQEDTVAKLSKDDMDLRLYLQDGTELAAVPAQVVAEGKSSKLSNRILATAMKLTVLEKWEDAHVGLVFFKATPSKAFSFKGTQVVHRDGKLEHALDLSHSLVAFNAEVDDQLVPFYVGVTRQVMTGVGK